MTNKSMSHYLQSFSEWMEVLGYSEATAYYMKRILQEFFKWSEQNNISRIEDITAGHTTAFINYNKTRPKLRGEGSICASQVNRYIDVIRKFNEYTRQTQGFAIPINVMRLEEDRIRIRLILSIEEIKALYNATDETPYGIRDRAMLAVYYGCGLRKTEGVELDVSDILIERKMIYIRKCKNNYERCTPITTGNLKHIEQYIYNARPLFLSDMDDKHSGSLHSGVPEGALFISERGARISKERFYQRLKELCKTAGITKEIGIHTLRHSIATHLLQSGMELENIALFLGHRCLDSTQLYTHLINEK